MLNNRIIYPVIVLKLESCTDTRVHTPTSGEHHAIHYASRACNMFLVLLLQIYDGGRSTDKFDSWAELRKGGFGKLFRDPRKITSPRRAIPRGGRMMRFAGKTGRTTSVFCLRPGTRM